MEFVVVTPPYTAQSAGIVVMHELCDSLNKLGHKAAIIFARSSGQFDSSSEQNSYGPNLQWHPLHDQNEFDDFIDNGIIIYPEIVTGNPLNGKRVVRYLLNIEGAIGGNSMEASKDDFILSFSYLYHKNPHAYLIKLPANSSFNCENSAPSLERSLDLTYIGKGTRYDQCFTVKNTLEITRQWPKSKPELALLLKQTRYFYTWDAISQTNVDAIFCGAIPIFLSARPLVSFSDLNKSELGPYPTADLNIQDNVISLDISEDFNLKLYNFKNNYMNLIKNYNDRLSLVIKKIHKHFSM